MMVGPCVEGDDCTDGFCGVDCFTEMTGKGITTCLKNEESCSAQFVLLECTLATRDVGIEAVAQVDFRSTSVVSNCWQIVPLWCFCFSVDLNSSRYAHFLETVTPNA